MKERPIIFSGPMVRAILENRKSQTRRVIEPQPSGKRHTLGKCTKGLAKSHLNRLSLFFEGASLGNGKFLTDHILSPYGDIGDRLWVRETWKPVMVRGDQALIKHKATPDDSKEVAIGGSAPNLTRRGWRPSIHMPRWASRINLEITGVRVERVQEIGEADAIAEGIYKHFDDDDDGPVWGWRSGMGYVGPPINAFRALWDSINAKRGFGWDANPWVWVLEFKRV